MVIALNKFRQHQVSKSSISVGEWVSIARKNQGLTQEVLGEAIGCSQALISRMETGQAAICPDDIAAIAGALGDSGLLERFCAQCPVCRAAAKIGKWPRPAA